MKAAEDQKLVLAWNAAGNSETTNTALSVGDFVVVAFNSNVKGYGWNVRLHHRRWDSNNWQRTATLLEAQLAAENFLREQGALPPLSTAPAVAKQRGVDWQKDPNQRVAGIQLNRYTTGEFKVFKPGTAILIARGGKYLGDSGHVAIAEQAAEKWLVENGYILPREGGAETVGGEQQKEVVIGKQQPAAPHRDLEQLTAGTPVLAGDIWRTDRQRRNNEPFHYVYEHDAFGTHQMGDDAWRRRLGCKTRTALDWVAEGVLPDPYSDRGGK